MRRAHRRAHRLIWPALAVAVVLGFALSLAWRPAIPVESPVSDAGEP